MRKSARRPRERCRESSRMRSSVVELKAHRQVIDVKGEPDLLTAASSCFGGGHTAPSLVEPDRRWRWETSCWQVLLRWIEQGRPSHRAACSRGQLPGLGQLLPRGT